MNSPHILMNITIVCLALGMHAVCKAGGVNSMEQLRINMVKSQIEARGVKDERVISVMKKVERHRFVPGSHVTAAYEDHPLPIGHGQTISQPYIVALMSELCELGGNEKVLEIGTGSGYQAAILSLLAREVYSIEIIEAHAKSARLKMKEMGYDNVTVIHGDGYKGLPEKAPFDVIILTASPPVIPKALIDQLADGGILVSPEGDYMQELVQLKKSGNQIVRKSITYVRFVPMVHEHE